MYWTVGSKWIKYYLGFELFFSEFQLIYKLIYRLILLYSIIFYFKLMCIFFPRTAGKKEFIQMEGSFILTMVSLVHWMFAEAVKRFFSYTR